MSSCPPNPDEACQDCCNNDIAVGIVGNMSGSLTGLSQIVLEVTDSRGDVGTMKVGNDSFYVKEDGSRVKGE